MKPRPALLVYSLLLFFLLTGLACSLANRLQTAVIDPTPTRPRRFVVLPAQLPPTSAVQLTPYAPLAPPAAPGVLEGPNAAPPAVSELPGAAGTDIPFTYSNEAATLPEATAMPATPTFALPEPGVSPAPSPENQEEISAPRPVRRPTPTPEPNGLLGAFSELLEFVTEPEVTATPTHHLIFLPSPTAMPSPTPTATPTNTPVPTGTPTPLPTLPPTPTPLPTPTPGPTSTPYPTPVPAPTEPPVPTPTPVPDYDFMLAEFFNSPTSNSFLVMYVAVVDANDIPIGDMKVVGTRLDHNLTYDSPLSTWHYEGYNAPGEVIKSGNLKFEPPGGIETTNWVLHLEDANGVRHSDDIPFDTMENDKQWYFVKLKRKY